MSTYQNRPASDLCTRARFVQPVTGEDVTVTALEINRLGGLVIDYRTDDGQADFVTVLPTKILSINLRCAS